MLAQSNILTVPGAADALTARLSAQAGFGAVYATGAGNANAQFGLPDIGLLISKRSRFKAEGSSEALLP